MADLTLDHVGIQVREIGPTAKLLCTLFGYRQVTDPVVNTRHGVEIVFLEKPGSLSVKLFRNVAEASKQPPRLHHLAFYTDDLPTAIADLSSGGARVLNEPAPGEAFDDELVAFLFAGGLNIELVSTHKRRARRDGTP